MGDPAGVQKEARRREAAQRRGSTATFLSSSERLSITSSTCGQSGVGPHRYVHEEVLGAAVAAVDAAPLPAGDQPPGARAVVVRVHLGGVSVGVKAEGWWW